jgi:hypothetical protein
MEEENWNKFRTSGSIYDYLDYKRCTRDTYDNNTALADQVGGANRGTDSESDRDRFISSTYW